MILCLTSAKIRCASFFLLLSLWYICLSFTSWRSPQGDRYLILNHRFLIVHSSTVLGNILQPHKTDILSFRTTSEDYFPLKPIASSCFIYVPGSKMQQFSFCWSTYQSMNEEYSRKMWCFWLFSPPLALSYVLTVVLFMRASAYEMSSYFVLTLVIFICFSRSDICDTIVMQLYISAVVK